MELPTIATPPADYPWIVALLCSILGILLVVGGIVIRKVGSFVSDLLDKLEKRADAERSRTDAERDKSEKREAEALHRWELGEKSKQERGDRLDAKISESNREITDLVERTHDEATARIAAQEKATADLLYRIRRLEEKSGITPPKEGGN